MSSQPKGLKLGDKYDIYQDIDLKRVTGVDLTQAPRLREEIIQAFIDEIIERTENGKDIFGNNLKGPYSKEYSESEEFKDADKSRSDVNMTLSGDMLLAIDAIGGSGNRVRLGFDNELDKKKAANHNNGITAKFKRQFFGITESRMEDIISEQFSSEIAELKVTKKDERMTAADVLRDTRVSQTDIFGGLFAGVLFDDQN